MNRGSAPGERRGGRQCGSLNKRTVAKLADVGRDLAEARKQNVPRAKIVLQDLMVTAIGFAAHYQRKILEFEAAPENVGKLPERELIDRFMLGINAAVRIAAALAPYQDPKLSAVRVSMSPLDAPQRKIDRVPRELPKDAAELARIYAQMVGAA